MSTPVASRGAAAAIVSVVDAVPRVAGFALTSLGVVGTPLLLIDAFHPLPVLLGSGLLLVALEYSWQRHGPVRRPVPRRTALISVFALLVAVVFTGVNARYASQHLLVDGDPAVYAVSGQLLADNGSIVQHTRANALFGGAARLNYAGTGFDADADEATVRPSFMHLLPEVLAVASWAGGPTLLLRANAVLAGLALLAVFACGVRLVGPVWSLMAMAALALLLPEQHFSRDAFSEIPSQLLLFAGLTLLIDLIRRRDRLRCPILLGAVGGLVIGASCLARIDAFVTLIPLVVFLTVLSVDGARRLAAGLLAGLGVTTVLGVLDLVIASPSYLRLQGPQVRLIIVALAVVLIAGTIVATQPVRAKALWARLGGPTLGSAAAGFVGLLAIYAYAVRPHVAIARNLVAGQPTPVNGLQVAEGMPVELGRSYDELSMRWIGWYVGPVALALGVLGFALLLRRVLANRRGRDGDLAVLLVLLVVGASSALYLWKPSVSPVQYWATRRFLPLTFPGLLLCAGWCLGRLWDAGGRARHRGAWLIRTGAALGVVALLAPPLSYLRGHLRDRDYVPMLAATRQICAALGPHDAVLLLGAPISMSLPQTVGALCGVPVGVLDNTTTHADLDVSYRLAKKAGKRLVYLSPVERQVIFDGFIDADYRKVVDLTVSVEALSLTRRPSARFAFPLTVWFAVAPPPGPA